MRRADVIVEAGGGDLGAAETSGAAGFPFRLRADRRDLADPPRIDVAAIDAPAMGPVWIGPPRQIVEVEFLHSPTLAIAPSQSRVGTDVADAIFSFAICRHAAICGSW